MGFWLTFFLFVGFTVIGELLRPKPKFDAPKPSGLGDFTLPTAMEGRAIPVAFGTVKMAGPNVTWYGDLAVRPIKKKVKTGFFSSKKITVGYRYYLGAQLVLCHGEIDALVELRFDDRPVPFANPDQVLVPILYTGTGSITNEKGLTTNLHESVDDASPNDTDFIRGLRNLTNNWGFRLSSGLDPGTNKRHVLTIRTRVPNDNPFNATDHFLAGISVGGGSNIVFTNKPWPGSTTKPAVLDMTTPMFRTHTYELSEAEAALIRTFPGGYTDLRVGAIYYTGFDSATVADVSQVKMTVPGAGPSFGSGDVLTLNVDAPTFFGGEEGEGGVQGRIDLYRGTLTQTANDYLQGAIPATLPAYRGISYAVLRQIYVGNSPYIKPISFVIRRCPNGLGLSGGRHNIGNDANPAAMIYEILTNDRWGLGIASSLVDVDALRAVGDLLHTESFGLSMIFDSAGSARDLLNEILRHIDGIMYTDPVTGKITVTLARANYNPGDPFLLDDLQIESCTVSRASWADTKNIVKVRYVDRDGNFTDRIAQAQDLANIQVRGGEPSEEVFDYRGVSNAILANKIASRELKSVAYPLAPIHLVVKRPGWKLRPGQVFRLRWAPLGIVDMACRITRISPGTLRDGRIEIDAVEDIFGVAATAYTPPGGSSWVDPIQAPENLAAARLLEVPYALVVGADRLVMTLGAQGNAATLGYEVWSDTEPSGISPDYAFSSEVRELTPSPLLARDVWYSDNSIVVAPAPGLNLIDSGEFADYAAGKNLVLINNEIIAWEAISLLPDGNYMLVGCIRGVADTTPAAHGVGQRAWFINEGSGLATNAALVSDVTVAAKLLAFTSKGTIELANATALSHLTTSRATRPYVPRDVLIQGLSYVPGLYGASDITVSWSHRNRLAEWTWDNGGLSSPAEPGTTYTLRFFGHDGLLKRTYSGLTGTSQTWTTEVADAGARQQAIRITLEALVGSLTSHQMFDFTIYRSWEVQGRTPEFAVGTSRRRKGRPRIMDAGTAE